MTLRTAKSATAARARIRSGEHVGPTSGLAPGFAQANLVVLAADDALDFLRFCVRNPKPCPLLEVTDTGSPQPSTLASDADLRTDLPRYRVFRDGELVDEPTDVTRLLARRSGRISARLFVHLRMGSDRRRPAAGAPGTGRQRPDVRHESPLRSAAGRFEGPLVVSMRPFAPDDIAARRRDLGPLSSHARRPCARRGSRGAGYRRIWTRPTSAIRCGSHRIEVPVFWACGVTPQAVVLEAQAVAGDLPRPRPHVHHRSTTRRIRLRGEAP